MTVFMVFAHARGKPCRMFAVFHSQDLRLAPPTGFRHSLRGGESAIVIEEQFKQVAEMVALVIQAGAVLVVTIGSVQAVSMVAASLWRRDPAPLESRQIWLRFATWILLALEFALAADIVRTAITPSWEDIGKLAVIATIRTMLNYFLAKDIASLKPDISSVSG